MTRVFAVLAALCFGLLAPAAPVPRERVPPDDAAIKKRFYQCWHEAWIGERAADGTRRVRAKAYELAAYEFDENGGWIWDWGGELSPVGWYPVELDTPRTPMRFEMVSNGTGKTPQSTYPGIFKFEGERLILAYPVQRWVKWNAGGEYKERPTDFEPRPGVVIAYLERCESLQQYSPPEQVPQRP